MSLSCDPNDLAQAAKCFKCLMPVTQLEVQTYLLCQIYNNQSIPATPTVFVSPLITLTNQPTVYSAAHGLGRTPNIIQARMVALAVDPNLLYPIGEEFDVYSIFDVQAGASFSSVSCDATKVTLNTSDPFVGQEVTVLVPNFTGGGPIQPASWTNFALKFIAF
jgi:hypothetical protein